MIEKNKTYMVVGAGGRLGCALVSAMLDQGFNVVAADHSQEALDRLQALCGSRQGLLCLAVDITSAETINNVFSKAAQVFGVIDGAVNTAYPRNQNYGQKFFDVTYEDFCENLSLHLGGYFLFMQQCAKYAISTGQDFSLVNMSSIYGVMAPRFEIYENTDMTMPIEYAAIKSALQHLVRYAAAYTKGTGFRVNAVSPGGILAGQAPEFLSKYDAHCSSKGMLDADDVVSTVIFLLSDQSKYIVGQNIVVDDGFSI